MKKQEPLAKLIVVCLGATAAQAILGRSFKVTVDRGKVLSAADAPAVVATVHPSALLRAPDDETRRRSHSSRQREEDEN